MKTNKILAAVLALTLTTGAAMPLGVTVNAASDTNNQLVDVARIIVSSGTCGKNATWSIDSEGLLIISGTGAIKENAFYDNEAVKKVIIEDGITSIGRSVFHYCDNLESVSIPDSVTNIDTNAFNLCRKLESITIPDSVTSMGTDVFQGCIGLKSVKLPSSITSINIRLFGRCYSLESIDIPDSVTSICMDAFEQCTCLETIKIPDSVVNIGTEAFKGTVWLENKKKENPLVIVNGILIDGTSCSGDVIIPDTVKSIAGSAFMDCDGINTVIIPASITNIDHKAFQFCRNLNSVTIMNPDCTINGDQTTIYNGGGFNGTIIGYNGSTAEAYAREYNYQFESLGDYVTSETTTTLTTTTTTTTASEPIDTTTTSTTSSNITDVTTTTPQVTTHEPTENEWGDANCDGKVELADAILVMQSLANPNKYGISGTEPRHLTEQGKLNGDVDLSVKGLTANDALLIQEYMLHKIDTLDPVKRSLSDSLGSDDTVKTPQKFIHKSENPDSPITEVQVALDCTGDVQETMKVESIMGKDQICSEVVGLVGEPFSIETSSKFDNAAITYKVDKSRLGDTDFNDLMCLWYDEENDNFVELETVPDETDSTVTFNTSHFSKYLMVDGKAWFDTWKDIEQKLKPIYNQKHLNCVYGFCETKYSAIDPVKKHIGFHDSCALGIDHENDDPNDFAYYTCPLRTSIIKSLYKGIGENNCKGIMSAGYNYHGLYVKEISDPGFVYNGEFTAHGFDMNEKSVNMATYLTTLNYLANDKLPNIAIIVMTDRQVSSRTALLDAANKCKFKLYVIDCCESVDSDLKAAAEATGGEYYQYDANTVNSIIDIANSMYVYEYPDTDGDGFTDAEETNGWIYFSNGTQIATSTNPDKKDTDDDGLDDNEEIDPVIHMTEAETINGKVYKYYHKIYSDPNMKDSDYDGLTDKEEKALGTNALKADTDDDGINDKDEIDNGTDPLKPDTDRPVENAPYGQIKFEGEYYRIDVPAFSEGYYLEPKYSEYKTVSFKDGDWHILEYFIGSKLYETQPSVPGDKGYTFVDDQGSFIIKDRLNLEETNSIASGGLFIMNNIHDMIKGSYTKIDIDFVFYKTESGEPYKVCIYACSSDARQLYDKYASDIPHHWSAEQGDLRYYPIVDKNCEQLYRELTNKEPDTDYFYDLVVSVDKNHKGTSAFAYLWVNENNDVMATPCVYGNDYVKLVRSKDDFGILNEDVLNVPLSDTINLGQSFLDLYNKIKAYED